MKAAVWTDYGPPEVLQLREINALHRADGEVLVRVAAANVFPGDCELRRFEIHPLYWLPLRLYIGVLRPRIRVLGQEFAGEVVETGRSVTRVKVGDRIFAPTGLGGAYAEYISIPERLATPVPSNFSDVEAATLSVGGLNALHFLRVAEVRPGDRVLLYGAAGCIGTMAVQLAREMGTEVTAVDSTRKLDTLSAIGAACVIDYAREDFTRLGETWDVIIDMVGKSPWAASLACLREGGYYVHGNAPTSVIVRRLATAPFSRHKVRIALTGYTPEDLQHLSELAAQGRIRPVIDRTWPLDEIVEAHRYVDSGEKIGNVVLSI